MRIVSRVQFVHGVVGFLSGSSSEACASRDHSLYLFFFFLQTFKISICLFTEVKRQWAKLVLGWITASVHCSCL